MSPDSISFSGAKQYTVLSRAILSGASPQLRNLAKNGGNLMQRYALSLLHGCVRTPVQINARLAAAVALSKAAIARMRSLRRTSLVALRGDVIEMNPQNEVERTADGLISVQTFWTDGKARVYLQPEF
jgi:CO/xanthine dehydrogenase FAD-binding subunit